MGRSILVVEQFASQFRDRIAEKFPQVEVRLATTDAAAPAQAGDVSALFAFRPSLNEDLIQKAAKLEWLQFLSSGTDAIARLPSLAKHVVVTSCHGVHGPSVSEMAFLHMLVLARDYARIRRNQDRKVWDEFDQPLLNRKTVVILGVGLIAEALALRCKAFGMTVIGVSNGRSDVPNFDRMLPRTQFEEAAGLADFLVLLAPLSAETRGIVGTRVLAAMKPTAFLVNVARGPICDEQALLAALRERRIAGAGLDAHWVEPLPPGHPLWTMDNVMITPHIAGRNDRYADLVMPILLHNIGCFLEGRIDDMRNLKVRGARPSPG